MLSIQEVSKMNKEQEYLQKMGKNYIFEKVIQRPIRREILRATINREEIAMSELYRLISTYVIVSKPSLHDNVNFLVDIGLLKKEIKSTRKTKETFIKPTSIKDSICIK